MSKWLKNISINEDDLKEKMVVYRLTFDGYFYVGITTQELGIRVYKHFDDAINGVNKRNHHVTKVKSKIIDCHLFDKQVKVDILKSCKTKKGLLTAEQKLIRGYKEVVGHHLLNIQHNKG